MDILGHTQIDLTMNTYGNAFVAVQREAATRMAEILSRGDIRFAAEQGVEQNQQIGSDRSTGATLRDRTGDLLITNQY